MILFFLFSGRNLEKAELVLLNGKIFTGDSDYLFTEALAVKEGKIIALGESKSIRRFIGEKTKTLDLKGKLVIPGLIDAHCHLSSGGRSLKSLNFRGVNSVEKIQEIIAEKIKEFKQGQPLFGVQFDHTIFPEEKWPTKEDLDKVSPQNPVIIERVDGHTLWVNTFALQKSGITAETKDPPGGEILRDPLTGEPTGILKESAMKLIKIEEIAGKDILEEEIKRALTHATSLGLTGIHTSSTLEELEILHKLRKEGKLTVRLYAWLPFEEIDACLEKGIRQGSGDEMLRVGFLKLYIDGTISSGTALLFEPFSDQPQSYGIAQYPEEEFNRLVEKAHRFGFQVGVHAIGDKGIHWTLNAIERAQKIYGKKGLRHRIEHCSLLHPQDIERFQKLGVIASMQPTHCTTDLLYCEKRFGRERSKYAYLWKTLLQNGVVLAFGSDWPVEPLDPMRGIYSLLTRKNIESKFPEKGWFPEECLSREEAIRGFTSGPSFASFEENIKGSLSPGKLADFLVLSKDLFKVNAEEVLETRVLYTFLGGKVVYRSEELE